LPEFTITTPAPPHSDLVRRGPSVNFHPPPPPYHSQPLPSPPVGILRGIDLLLRCLRAVLMRLSAARRRLGGPVDVEKRRTAVQPEQPQVNFPASLPPLLRGQQPPNSSPLGLFIQIGWGVTVTLSTLIPSNLFSAFVYMIINPR
jgi:hypothetical protein